MAVVGGDAQGAGGAQGATGSLHGGGLWRRVAEGHKGTTQTVFRSVCAQGRGARE